MLISNTKNRLCMIMNERQLRQVDLLERCKPYCNKFGVAIRKNDLSQYLSGKTEPNQHRLYILSLALNVSIPYLMGYDEPQAVVSKTATTAPEQRHLEKYRRLTVDNRTKLDNYMDGLLYEQEDYFQKREQQYSTS